jgi:ribosome maturation factor RimP
MDKNEIHARLLEMAAPLCEARGIDIWGIELLFGAGGRHNIVRVYLDSAKGVGIDECTAVSRHLSLALDVEDIIPGAFTLEVSSPGLERPFFSPEQMNAYVGRKVRVRLHTPLEGRKNFKGSPVAVTPPRFTLSDGEDTFELDWEDVGKANLVYEHPDQGKPGKR